MSTARKEIGFTKGAQHYAIRYADVRDLIHCLVDYADDPRHALDLMDVFILVHRIAYLHTRERGQPTP